MVEIRYSVLAVIIAASVFFLGSPAAVHGQNWSDVVPFLKPSAVWNPPAVHVEQLRRSCWSTDDAMSARCLAEGMRKNAAPEDAVLLSSQISEGGFLQRIDTAGGVTLAWFTLPFRHNDNHVLLFVDRHGKVVDGGDISGISREQMMKDERYAALYDRYPGMTIWPSDRTPEHDVVIEHFPRGGMRVILEFRLLDGCRACRRIGFIRVGWYFGTEGNYRGSTFLGAYQQQ